MECFRSLAGIVKGFVESLDFLELVLVGFDVFKELAEVGTADHLSGRGRQPQATLATSLKK